MFIKVEIKARMLHLRISPVLFEFEVQKNVVLSLHKLRKNGLPACHLEHHCMQHLSFEYRRQFDERSRGKETGSGKSQARGNDAGLGKARGLSAWSCGDSS